MSGKIMANDAIIEGTIGVFGVKKVAFGLLSVCSKLLILPGISIAVVL